MHSTHCIKTTFLIIVGVFLLFTCNERSEPVSPGKNHPPTITAVADTRWFDFDHTTGAGAIKVSYRMYNSLPDDTPGIRIYLCSNVATRREITPENDSVFILGDLTPGVLWSCSLHVADSRSSTVDTVIPIPLPNVFPPLPPSPVLTSKDSTVIISWNAVADAAGYSVYRAASGRPFLPGGTFTQPAAGTPVSFTESTGTYSLQSYIIASVNYAGECRSRDTLFFRRTSRDIIAPSIDAVSKGAYTDHIRLCLHANDTTTDRIELYRSFSAEGPFKPVAAVPAVNSGCCFDDVVATTAVQYYKAASIDRNGRSGLLSAAEHGFIFTARTVAADIRADGYYDHNALSWNAVPGAHGYAVYRSADTCPDGMRPVARTTALVYRDSIASVDKFFYAVAVIDSLGHEIAMSTCAAAARCRVPGPFGFTVSDGSYHDSIVLTWDPIPGITSYSIYRSPASCPNFGDTIARTTRQHFADINVGAGYYSYTVAAVDIGGRDGLMSLCRRGRTAPVPAPVNLQVSFDENPDVITLSWDTLAGTGYYIVFRSSISCSSEMKKIDSTGAIGYTDTVATSGIYYYRIVGVDTNGIPGSAGDCGRGRVKPLPAPANVTASDKTYIDRIRISWDPVVGADGYIIFKGLSNVAEAATPLDTVTALYKFDDQLEAPLQYYWVAARNALGAGTRSRYVFGRALTPPELTLLSDSNPVVFSWNSDAAAGRTLFMRADETSIFECIDSNPRSPITVTLPDYRIYFFEILFKTSSGDSCFSNSVEASLPIPAPKGLSVNNTADTVLLRWNAVPGIATYPLFRSMSASETSWEMYATATDTSFIDIITAAGHYYYRVAAENGIRGSPMSDTAGVQVDSLPLIPEIGELQPEE